MKKLFTLCAIIMSMVVSLNGFSQSKQLTKALKKESAAKIKQMQKEGWKVDGSRTLEVSLLTHYDKLADGNNREMIAVASNGCKSRNVCQNSALNNAMIKYAQEAKAFLKGRVVSEVGTVGGEELDGFYSGYERLVAANIEGELKLSFAIYKSNNDGSIVAYEAYYIINEVQASKMRIKAMENAAKESAAAQKYATQIAEFVKQGFEQE